MSRLAVALERLVAEFVADLLHAVQGVSLRELGRKEPAQRPVAPPRRKAAATRGRRARASAPARPVSIDGRMTEIVVAYFTERGRKGATAVQLHDHLREQGYELSHADGVVDTLAGRGLLRAAGFRRTTGKGTAPVFLLASAD